MIERDDLNDIDDGICVVLGFNEYEMFEEQADKINEKLEDSSYRLVEFEKIEISEFGLKNKNKLEVYTYLIQKPRKDNFLSVNNITRAIPLKREKKELTPKNNKSDIKNFSFSSTSKKPQKNNKKKRSLSDNNNNIQPFNLGHEFIVKKKRNRTEKITIEPSENAYMEYLNNNPDDGIKENLIMLSRYMYSLFEHLDKKKGDKREYKKKDKKAQIKKVITDSDRWEVRKKIQGLTKNQILEMKKILKEHVKEEGEGNMNIDLGAINPKLFCDLMEFVDKCTEENLKNPNHKNFAMEKEENKNPFDFDNIKSLTTNASITMNHNNNNTHNGPLNSILNDSDISESLSSSSEGIFYIYFR